MITSLIKRFVAKKASFPNLPEKDRAALDALAKGYALWDASSKQSFQKSTRLESAVLLDKALQQISATESRTQTNRTSSEKWLQRAFLYLFPPQSSITMGTWQMRL